MKQESLARYAAKAVLLGLIPPALLLVGWTTLGTNIFGIGYGTSTYINPQDTYVITYQSSTKTYELKAGGGGGGGITTINGGTGIQAVTVGTTTTVTNTGVRTLTAGTNVTLGGTLTDPIVNASVSGSGVNGTINGAGSTALTTVNVTGTLLGAKSSISGSTLNVSLDLIATGDVATANKDGLAAVPSMRTLGTGAQQALAGNDPSTTNSRTPTAHASTHLPGGTDALTTATGVSVGAANGTGTATSFARSDHTHAVTDLAISGQTNSDLLQFNGTNWVRKPVGANSTVLQVSSGGGLQYGTVTSAMITDGTITDVDVATANKDGANGTASMRTLGTSTGQALAGNDASVTNARTPTAHAASHQNGGTDEVATATPTANAIPKANGSNKFASGWMSEVLNLADLLDVSAKTGTGSTVVMDTSPTIVTPILSGTPASSGAFGFASSEGLIFNSAAHKILTDEFKIVIQTFTSGGTYTPTANTIFAVVEADGGGGGSGGVLGVAADILCSGAGGAGSSGRKVVLSPTAVSFTIGAAGAAGASGNNPGGAGGDTNFNSGVCIGKGGSGGTAGTSGSIGIGGAGGTVSTGDVTSTGQPGANGLNVASTTFQLAAGNGGSGPFGGGGRGAIGSLGSAVAGGAGSGFGSGGGGSNVSALLGNAAGAAGTAGILIVTDYVRR